MCLTLKGVPAIPKRAEEDITCYKVLAKSIFISCILQNETEEVLFFTPYLCMDVELGKEYTEDEGDDFHVKHDGTDGFEVREGGYHLFVNEEDAEKEKISLSAIYKIQDYVVVKAIVPKGALYIEGVCGYHNLKCVVTKKVRYEKI